MEQWAKVSSWLLFKAGGGRANSQQEKTERVWKSMQSCGGDDQLTFFDRGIDTFRSASSHGVKDSGWSSLERQQRRRQLSADSLWKQNELSRESRAYH